MNLNAHTCSVHLLANKFWHHITYSAWTGNALDMLALVQLTSPEKEETKTILTPLSSGLWFFIPFFCSFSCAYSFFPFCNIRCDLFSNKTAFELFCIRREWNVWHISIQHFNHTINNKKKNIFAKKYCDIKSQLLRISKSGFKPLQQSFVQFDNAECSHHLCENIVVTIENRFQCS